MWCVAREECAELSHYRLTDAELARRARRELGVARRGRPRHDPDRGSKRAPPRGTCGRPDRGWPYSAEQPPTASDRDRLGLDRAPGRVSAGKRLWGSWASTPER